VGVSAHVDVAKKCVLMVTVNQDVVSVYALQRDACEHFAAKNVEYIDIFI
jgi:hypothetical protein